MLIVIAEKEELKLVEELGFNNKPILITGVGGVNVINALKDIPRDTDIVNIGYAGSNSIKIGEIVKIGRVETLHENAKFKEPEIWCDCGNVVCYTSTDFVLHTDIKEKCVFDMELAFIKALGFKNVYAYKKVSDTLNKEEYKKRQQNNLNNM